LIFLAATARGRVTVAITCSVIAAMLSFSAATAEDEIPAGSGSVALSQDAAQDAPTGEGVAPATADATVTDPPAVDPGVAPAPTDEWVEPAASDAATDTGSTATLTDAAGSVDPAPDTWTDPAPVDPASAAPEADPATGEVIAPATGQAVASAPVEAGPDGLAPPIEAAPVEPSLPSGPEAPGQPIATAYVAGTGGDGAPCLAAPQWGAETLAVLAEGQPVEVRAETMGEWQPVNCAGAGGYVHVALIAWTPVGSSDPATAGGEQPGGKTGGGGDAVGEQIVSFALQFQGYPYIYAGEGPYAFDCSGFTMFVIHNTLGINIPHDMFVQYQLGRPVSRDELQPGDLVFFQNTFRPGMSHDGIYIGGGQFIHAETESSGVRISDLDSDYYSSRWYGAVRFA
jgi:cell wall-associated NlpC family hydrolase